MDYNFDEWRILSFEQKREIWNHYWNPYEPKIGYETKRAIVENFMKTLKIEVLQCGLRSFGWYVYELYVVVNDSKIRVPKKFEDLNVNKGLLIRKIDDGNLVNVKFEYGGTLQIDLSQKIYIG